MSMHHARSVDPVVVCSSISPAPPVTWMPGPVIWTVSPIKVYEEYDTSADALLTPTAQDSTIAATIGAMHRTSVFASEPTRFTSTIPSSQAGTTHAPPPQKTRRASDVTGAPQSDLINQSPNLGNQTATFRRRR